MGIYRYKPAFTITKTARVDNDPVNGTVSPKAIPNANVVYDIKISNSGQGVADTDSLAIKDIFSGRVDLLFTGFGGGGSPVLLTQGSTPTVACGVTLDFVSLSSTSDDIEFLNTASVAITPNPNPVTKIDPVVRGIRLRPSGSFAPASGAASSSCTFSYPMKVN